MKEGANHCHLEDTQGPRKLAQSWEGVAGCKTPVLVNHEGMRIRWPLLTWDFLPLGFRFRIWMEKCVPGCSCYWHSRGDLLPHFCPSRSARLGEARANHPPLSPGVLCENPALASSLLFLTACPFGSAWLICHLIAIGFISSIFSETLTI